LPVVSMTGYGHADGEIGAFRWTWDLRSVNGRGLDLRLRLPSDLQGLETVLREKAGKTLRRGNIQISLQLSQGPNTAQIKINQEALHQVLAALAEIERQSGLAPSTASGILGIRGIVEQIEPQETEAEREARHAAILRSFDEALAMLGASRANEGARLHTLIKAQVEEIGRLTSAAEARAAGAVALLRQRLTDQLAALLDAPSALSPDRLAAEVALLVTKADIREEIDRLHAHVAHARELLEDKGQTGRKLDFLVQEFNREANTLCSKSPETALTRIGLDLKAQIDQMREQVQNIE
jgi:uncharacterized protein (TIGR00255 family)